jgi:hypothetical protein
MTTLAAHPPRRRDVLRGVVWPTAFAAALSLSAGLVHLGGIASHFREWWAYGLFFAVAGVLQAALAVLLLRRPRPWLALVAIPGNLAIVGMYVLTRTNGPPFGPHAGRPEDPELLGMATCAAELAVVVLLLRLLGERVGRAVTTGILLLGLAAWALRIEGTLL